MKAGELGDRCPACGAPRTAFEPYNDPVSTARRRRLNLQLHHIGVHFPVTLGVAILVFSVAIFFLSGDARTLVLDATKVLSLLFPLVVALAFLAGWIDGKVRFRKIRNSRVLKRKILYACFLFAASIGVVLDTWLGGFSTTGATLVDILLGAAAVVLVYVLGLLGTSIVGALFPGK